MMKKQNWTLIILTVFQFFLLLESTLSLAAIPCGLSGPIDARVQSCDQFERVDSHRILQWDLVFRTSDGEEGWRNRWDHQVWSKPLGKGTFLEALRACELLSQSDRGGGLAWEVPDRRDFVYANSNSLNDFQNKKYRYKSFWTRDRQWEGEQVNSVKWQAWWKDENPNRYQYPLFMELHEEKSLGEMVCVAPRIDSCGDSGSVPDRVADCARILSPRVASWNPFYWALVNKTVEGTEVWLEHRSQTLWSSPGKGTYNESIETCQSSPANLVGSLRNLKNIHWDLPTLDQLRALGKTYPDPEDVIPNWQDYFHWFRAIFLKPAMALTFSSADRVKGERTYRGFSSYYRLADREKKHLFHCIARVNLSLPQKEILDRECGGIGSIEERISNCSEKKTTSNGHQWALVTRTHAKKEVWLNKETNRIWGDIFTFGDFHLSKKTVLKSFKFGCTSQYSKLEMSGNIQANWKLPSKSVMVKANKQEIFEVLPRMKNGLFWTSSSRKVWNGYRGRFETHYWVYSTGSLDGPPHMIRYAYRPYDAVCTAKVL